MQDFNACKESVHVNVNDDLRQIPLCFELCDLDDFISQSVSEDPCAQDVLAYRHLVLPWLVLAISTKR